MQSNFSAAYEWYGFCLSSACGSMQSTILSYQCCLSVQRR